MELLKFSFCENHLLNYTDLIVQNYKNMDFNTMLLSFCVFTSILSTLQFLSKRFSSPTTRRPFLDSHVLEGLAVNYEKLNVTCKVLEELVNNVSTECRELRADNTELFDNMEKLQVTINILEEIQNDIKDLKNACFASSDDEEDPNDEDYTPHSV